MKNCTDYIKFILFYKNLDPQIQDELLVKRKDIKEIVSLRHDITHFNEYIISEFKLKKFIVFLEFLVIFALLKLINYKTEDFVINIYFYSLTHELLCLDN